MTTKVPKTADEFLRDMFLVGTSGNDQNKAKVLGILTTMMPELERLHDNQALLNTDTIDFVASLADYIIGEVFRDFLEWATLPPICDLPAKERILVMQEEHKKKSHSVKLPDFVVGLEKNLAEACDCPAHRLAKEVGTPLIKTAREMAEKRAAMKCLICRKLEEASVALHKLPSEKKGTPR